jgi:hypothetical protein
MKRYLLTAGAIALSLVAFSQTDAGARWLGAKCHALIGETKYISSIGPELVVGGPTWEPSKPLPLSFANVERIARTELAKLTKDEGAWEVIEFSLHRANGSVNWYYQVGMRPISPRMDPRYFSVYLSADGKAGGFHEER